MAKLHSKDVQAALAGVIASGRVTPDVGKPLVEKGLAGMPAPKAPVVNAGAAPKPSAFAIIDGAVLPPSKRGSGRVAGPSKYPFDDLQPGQTFFVAADAETPNPLKTLGSAVSNATNKYRVDTGKTKEVVRTKRGEGNKAVLDSSGAKVRETATVPVYEYKRKFSIRGVKAGQVCGSYTAPMDGVLIGREV